jgi:hypothetical protein
MAGLGSGWSSKGCYDPGRLSAAFTRERLGRLLAPDVVRYVVGGWRALVQNLAARPEELGVVIQPRTTLRAFPPRPVVVATSPAPAPGCSPRASQRRVRESL